MQQQFQAQLEAALVQVSSKQGGQQQQEGEGEEQDQEMGAGEGLDASQDKVRPYRALASPTKIEAMSTGGRLTVKTPGTILNTLFSKGLGGGTRKWRQGRAQMHARAR
jgi:hypothetical protein